MSCRPPAPRRVRFSTARAPRAAPDAARRRVMVFCRTKAGPVAWRGLSAAKDGAPRRTADLYGNFMPIAGFARETLWRRGVAGPHPVGPAAIARRPDLAGETLCPIY